MVEGRGIMVVNGATVFIEMHWLRNKMYWVWIRTNVMCD